MLGATSATLYSASWSPSWTTGKVTVTQHTEEGGGGEGGEEEAEAEGGFKINSVITECEYCPFKTLDFASLYAFYLSERRGK